jgi:hypothetical protein
MPYADIQGLTEEALVVNYTLTNNSGNNNADETVQLDANLLTPDGNDGGTATNGNPVDQQTVTLDDGESEALSLTWEVPSGEPRGYYDITVESSVDTSSITAEVGQGDMKGLWAMSGYDGSTILSSVQVFDGDRWTTYSGSHDKAHPVGQVRHKAVSYEGELFTLGGKDSLDNIDTLARWDGSSWSTGTVSSNADVEPAVATYDGHLYVCGGDGPTSTVQVYDGSSWATTDSLNVAAELTSGEAYDGYLYVCGGRTGVDSLTTKVQRYDGSSWETDTDNGGNGSHHSLEKGVEAAASAVYDGYLWVIGGYDGSTTVDNVQRFDGDTWIQDTDHGSGNFQSIDNEGVQNASAAVYDGDLYVAGGNTNNSSRVTTVRKFDGSSWTKYESGATALNNGIHRFGMVSFGHIDDAK